MIDITVGMGSARNLRAKFIQLVYALMEDKADRNGILVLVEPKLTENRLKEEWDQARQTLQEKVLDRLHLVVFRNGKFNSFPSNFDSTFYSQLEQKIKIEQEHVGMQMNRGSSYFVIVKILIHQWLLKKGPMTVKWLAESTGYSYPTVASILKDLGSMIERQSDRRIGLNQFPTEAFARLIINSEIDRSAVCYTDYSNQPFSTEFYIRRLEKLNLPDLAIGGVLGARHYYPELDLVGTPRLDLSRHSSGESSDLEFINKLDPALKPVDDPYQPADVVVHFVRHKKSFFEPREGGLFWADPVECLLDLHELHLEAQATEFLNVLQSRRQTKS